MLRVLPRPSLLQRYSQAFFQYSSRWMFLAVVLTEWMSAPYFIVSSIAFSIIRLRIVP